MPLPHIPILRRGVAYRSLDRIELVDHRGRGPVAAISQANAGLIRKDLARLGESRRALQAIPAARLLDICTAAGELFMNADLPLDADTGATQSPRQYIESLTATSGLPFTLVRRNMAKLHEVFTQMPTILWSLTRGLPSELLDNGLGEHDGLPLCYFPAAEALGVVMPSNSPGVNSIWMPAIALKMPVIIKPGREEPWTPWRIMQAFIAAGCPREAFSFYPADHEGAAAILKACGRSLLFGDTSTTAPYSHDPRVQIHGPGFSKVLVGEDQIDHWPEWLDVLFASVADNSGRSCVNASTIVVPRHAPAIADALAKRLAAIGPRPLDDPDAVLAGFANPKFADYIDDAITQGLRTPGAVDATAHHRTGPRKIVVDGTTYVLPTLIHCDSFAHPLANREFLFPYASAVESPQAQMLQQIGPSLVVTAITGDGKFIDELVSCPWIDRLNIGPLPTSRLKWDQPHEGNLFEFLYRRRAFQSVPA